MRTNFGGSGRFSDQSQDTLRHYEEEKFTKGFLEMNLHLGKGRSFGHILLILTTETI